MKDLVSRVQVVVKALNLKVIWQTTSKNCIKVRAACEARLFFPIQPIRSSFPRVIVAVLSSAGNIALLCSRLTRKGGAKTEKRSFKRSYCLQSLLSLILRTPRAFVISRPLTN